MNPVKIAVIPAAGLGTRLFPATKAVPKELLPILDRPSVMYVLDEAVAAGIEQVVLVSGPGKGSLEDFFDTNSKTIQRLKSEGKPELVNQFLEFRRRFHISFVYQEAPLGLGHAILQAKKNVGDLPFLVMLPDELNLPMNGSLPPTRQICNAFEKTGTATVWVTDVPRSEVNRYGVVDLGGLESSEAKKFTDTGLKVNSLVEKPDPVDAPSLFVLPGRYVFTPAIFSHIESTKPGRLGEIQLTDAMHRLSNSEGLMALNVKAHRFDVGNRDGLVKTIVAYAMRDPALSASLKEVFREDLR